MPPVRFPNANVTQVQRTSVTTADWTFDLPVTLTGANVPELQVTHLAVDRSPTSCSQFAANVIRAVYGVGGNPVATDPWKITSLPTNVDVPIQFPVNGLVI